MLEKYCKLNVYNAGVIHTGALTEDEFTLQTANALVKYVNSAKPTDYERTVYYVDFDLQIDISIKNGEIPQLLKNKTKS